MSWKRIQRGLAAAILGVALLWPCTTEAAEPRDRQTTIETLRDWWAVLIAIWGEEGCRIDPYGRCAAAAEPSEAGCRLDPYGRCAM